MRFLKLTEATLNSPAILVNVENFIRIENGWNVFTFADDSSLGVKESADEILRRIQLNTKSDDSSYIEVVNKMGRKELINLNYVAYIGFDLYRNTTYIRFLGGNRLNVPMSVEDLSIIVNAM